MPNTTSSNEKTVHDSEKQEADAVIVATTAQDFEELDDGVPRNQAIFRKMWQVVKLLDRFGLEARGIERVQPQERTQKSTMDCMSMWVGANVTVATFSLGALGVSVFELDLCSCALVIIFFNLLSTAPVAYFSCYGAATGLRQMVRSHTSPTGAVDTMGRQVCGRYSFGYYAVWFPAVLNLFATIGWSVINTIVGGQTLNAVSQTHQLPIAASTVIIAVLSLIPPLAGYRFVHNFERWAWVFPLIVFIIMLGEGGKYMDSGLWSGTGSVQTASVLSYGATVVGNGLGWVSYAADYTVNLPERTPPWKIFLTTYLGLNLALIFVETLGAAYMTTLTTKSTWKDRYDQSGIGGLVAAGLSPMGGFGQFLTVLMGLSNIASNVPNLYSLSLTFQVFGPIFQAIPRIFVTLLGTVVYVALAIVGASRFDSVLNNLLVILSYWLSIYATILFEEHIIFRGNSFKNYDLTAYGKPHLLPPGFAAAIACGCGIAGAVVGMAQTWYIGPLGKKIDATFGGDIGFELAAAFTAFSYPLLRYIEKTMFGR